MQSTVFYWILDYRSINSKAAVADLASEKMNRWICAWIFNLPDTAEQLVNKLAQEDLQKLFKEYGEERWAKRIAGNIVRIRRQKKIRTSKQLAQIVTDSIPGQCRGQTKDPSCHPGVYGTANRRKSGIG